MARWSSPVLPDRVLSYFEDGSPFDRWFMCFNRMTDIMNATGYSLVTWPHGKEA
jgi:hypothetical protein